MKTENSAHGFTEGSETSGSVAAPKEEPKEKGEVELAAKKLSANLYKENKELRDQLRQRDELIKKVHQLMTVNVPSVQSAKYSEWIEVRSELDSLIKKSQKHGSNANN